MYLYYPIQIAKRMISQGNVKDSVHNAKGSSCRYEMLYLKFFISLYVLQLEHFLLCSRIFKAEN